MKSTILKYLTFSFRLVLGGVFTYSGFIKLQNLDGFEEAVKSYNFFPEWSWGYIVGVIPYTEVALGVLLILGLMKKCVPALLSLLILFFLAILTYKFSTGELVNCGCLSVDGELEQVTWKIMLRDGLFLLMGIFIFIRQKFSTV